MDVVIGQVQARTDRSSLYRWPEPRRSRVSILPLLWVCAALPALGFLSACRTAAPDAQTPTTVVATGEPISASDVLIAGEFRYQSRNDPGIALRVLREQSEPGVWTVRRWLLPAPGATERLVNQQRYIITPEGLFLAEQLDQSERVEVVFEPPMLLIPTLMPPGDRHEQSIHMTVHPLGNRKRVRAQGPAKSIIEYIGQERIDGPEGPISAALIRHHLTATLGAASVDNTTDQWLLPLRDKSPEPAWSLVAERRTEQTRVLGLQTRDNREHWILSPAPVAP